MNGLAQAERDFDRRIAPEAILVALLDDEEDCEPRDVTDGDIEDFISDLAASSDPVAFLESEANQHLDEIGDFDLHIAVAQQWAADKALVAPAIGRVFWVWAKACAYEVCNG